MSRYLVKTPINHDGEQYQPGETIELEPEQAAAMPWAVEPAEEPDAGDGEPKKRGKKGK